MSDQLTAIDDALETGAADHDDPLTRELQELALALRADAPGAGCRVPARARPPGPERLPEAGFAAAAALAARGHARFRDRRSWLCRSC